MENKFKTKICWIAVIGLLAGSLLCLWLVADRVAAAIFNLWKFSGYRHWQGIDLGAQSTCIFLIACLFGVTGCFTVISFCKSLPVLQSRIVTVTAGIYFINGLLLLLIISSGAGYLYCGR
jgi:hypothetical protein